MTTLQRILVANRGEIACRIIRTLQAEGRFAIAVYSDADAAAPHVAMADLALPIGPAPASQSYLDGEGILRAARHARADGVHPGYGFLSENAAFARACRDAGLVFIGPGERAIALMGDKAAARRRMQDMGVPCVPGYDGEAQDDAALGNAAKSIGYPLMVKAAAGGGGRGMRRVVRPDDLDAALRAARGEARSAFGDDRLILERAVDDARHVEVQVVADTFGTTLYLGERDCSVQRRHQKIIEEAPCPALDDELRAAMGEAAVAAARAIDYVNAGTVEFLLDGDGNFYFLEMNTRLQVEHPVTECVTGLDLVALQLRIADGKSIELRQDDIHWLGHAIEARLYAEDPAAGFMPATGHIQRWQPPPSSLARTDDGIASGDEITPYYDPMLAKIIVHGDDRDDARRKLIDALGACALFGPATNRDFLIRILQHPEFADGAATTRFLDNHLDAIVAASAHDRRLAAAAALHCYLAGYRDACARSTAVAAALRDWSSDGSLSSSIRLADGDDITTWTVRPCGNRSYEVADREQTLAFTVVDDSERHLRVVVDGERVDVLAMLSDKTVFVADRTQQLALTLPAAGGGSAGDAAGDAIQAPMHGRVSGVLVASGQTVSKGQRLLIIEAMKMQHDLVAPRDGVVEHVRVAADEQVTNGTLLIELAPAP